MSDRDDQKPEEMPVEERRRILLLLSAVITVPVVTVLFHGSADTWAGAA